jgi:glycine/D-amino acid oxidase-like deaminating enzyme
VCVVGLGGSGLAAIDACLRAHASVVGVDAGRVGGAAAGRNGGLLRAGTSLFYHEACTRYGADRASRMYASTVVERERVLHRLPGLARRCGYLRLAYDADEQRDCRAHLEALVRDGYPATWYDGALGTGVLTGDDAAMDPSARCHAEASLVSAGGARLYEQSPVRRLARGLLETDHGRVRCRVILVAVDGGLAGILPELEGRVRPIRLQMLASGPHAPGVLPHALGTRWGWDYGQQLPDGTIAFGGCRDAGGDAEQTLDAEPTAPVQAALERRFTEVTAEAPVVTHRWGATAGYTADGLPVLEQVRAGIWATGGYSGTGNLLGAACGRHAVEKALGVREETLLD